MNKRERISKMLVRILADVLSEARVRHCVVSPGSRNAPIVLELSRMRFDIVTVIDERTAGFVALGMAKALGEPVAVVCTSGSAALNLTPALAEAFYSRTPLLAVTADRPEADIDQCMGQTIRQTAALAAVVRCSVAIGENMTADTVNRLVNKAYQAAVGEIPGPVQINVHLSLPLTQVGEYPEREGHLLYTPVRITRSCNYPELYNPDLRTLILIGTRPWSDSTSLNESLEQIARSANIMVLSEIQSNVSAGARIADFSVNDAEIPLPDIAYIAGGTFVDAALLRRLAENNVPVVTVGIDDEPVTRGLNVVRHYDVDPEQFFSDFAGSLCASGCIYRPTEKPGRTTADDGRDVVRVLAMLPAKSHVFIANGMCIRHAQFSYRPSLRVMTNRGVSGIDGCTSTAVGAAIALGGRFFLLTGDMGAVYDIAALSVDGIPAGFHMIVIDNGGGDIFRHVATTATLPPDERERFFVVPPRPVLADYARNCGFSCTEINSENLTNTAINAFLTKRGPALLIIKQNV